MEIESLSPLSALTALAHASTSSSSGGPTNNMGLPTGSAGSPSGGRSPPPALGPAEPAPPPPPPPPPTTAAATTTSAPAAPEVAQLLPQLTQGFFALCDRVESLAETLREVHADMAALKAQYGVLAAAAQNTAAYGLQMTVTFTPQPLVTSPVVNPAGVARAHVPAAVGLASQMTSAHVTSGISGAANAASPFVGNHAASAASLSTQHHQPGPHVARQPPPGNNFSIHPPLGATVGSSSSPATTSTGKKRTLREILGGADGAGGAPQPTTTSMAAAAATTPRPASKKHRRDRPSSKSMFVFLDHINNKRLHNNNVGGGSNGGSETEYQHYHQHPQGDDEREVVGASSDEEDDDAGGGGGGEQAATSGDDDDEPEIEEDRGDDYDEDHEQDHDEQSDDKSSVVSVSGSGGSNGGGFDNFMEELDEPQHRQPIKWVGVDVPIEGKPLNHRLMPQKITKLEYLQVFWQRMKPNIKLDAAKGCWLCTCPRPTPNSYVRKSIGGKKFFAHILAYVVWNRTIDVNLPVVQLCGNRICLNPKHLSQVKDGPFDTDQRTDCLDRRTLETCPFNPPCLGHT